jgi:serine/threonine-protein kinase
MDRIIAGAPTLSIPKGPKQACQALGGSGKIVLPEPSNPFAFEEDPLDRNRAAEPLCPVCQHAHDPQGVCVLRRSAESAEPGVGSRLGPYYLQALVGEGGMGRVFRAVHGKLGRLVAIKLMRRSVSFGDGVQRFLREARVVNKARHQNLIEVTDIVEAPAGGDSYYVMEWLEGQNLHERMLECNGHMPIAEYLRILIEVTHGLQAAHEAGLVHRDLKPENIFLADRIGGLARERIVKIIDFGVALDLSERGPRVEDFIVGTPAYISPEQARGQSGDRRSDIYSLGVILYELAVGDLPFAASTNTETVALRLTTPPKRPRKAAKRGVWVPRALERIIMRCMADDPAARYQDMEELRVDLERLLRDLTGPAWRRLAHRGAWVLTPLAGLGLVAGLGWALHRPVLSGVRAAQERIAAFRAPPPEPEKAPEAPMLLQVEVRTSPSGAEVRYGGAVLGTTPCVVRLPEGTREIELRKPGHRREKRVVEVRVGARVSARLNKL